MTMFDTDVSATLQDLSGEIVGCIHRQVLDEVGKDFGVGSVLLLKRVGPLQLRDLPACYPPPVPVQVSVFSPRPGSHYVNITPDSVSRVFPSHSSVPSGAPFYT